MRFHALRCIHHQQCAFTGGQAAADLISKVDMARRIHQVQLISLAIGGCVVEADSLRLDGDPAFALNVHVIKHLFAHLTFGQPARELDQAVSQRGFAMVDMGNDAEIADVGAICHARPHKASRKKVGTGFLQKRCERRKSAIAQKSGNRFFAKAM